MRKEVDEELIDVLSATPSFYQRFQGWVPFHHWQDFLALNTSVQLKDKLVKQLQLSKQAIFIHVVKT